MKYMKKLMFLLLATYSMSMQAGAWYEKTSNQVIAIVTVCGLFAMDRCLYDSDQTLVNKADEQLENLDTCQDLLEEQPAGNKTQEDQFKEFLRKKFQVHTDQVKKDSNTTYQILNNRIRTMKSKLYHATQSLQPRRWVNYWFTSSIINNKKAEIKRLQDALHQVDSYKARSLEKFLLGHQIVNEHKSLMSLTDKKQLIGEVNRKYFNQLQSSLQQYMKQIATDMQTIDELLQRADYQHEFPQLKKSLQDIRQKLITTFDMIQASKEYKDEQELQLRKNKDEIEKAKLRLQQEEQSERLAIDRQKVAAALAEANARMKAAQAQEKDAETNRRRLQDERDNRERQDREEREEQERQARNNGNGARRNGQQRAVPVAHARPV